MPGPGRDLNFLIAGAGPGFKIFYRRGRDFFYCRGRAGIKKIYCWGWAGIKKNLLLRPGRDLYFFCCRGRAGIKKFEMTGAQPGLEKLKMPEPEFFLLSGLGRNLKIFIAGAGNRNFFLSPGPGRDLNFVLLPGPGFFLLPGLGPSRD